MPRCGRRRCYCESIQHDLWATVIPYLLAALYLGKYGKSQKAWFYSLGILFPSIVEKIALYSIGAFLYGIAPANIAGVMDAVAAGDVFVNLFTQPSSRYVINILADSS